MLTALEARVQGDETVIIALVKKGMLLSTAKGRLESYFCVASARSGTCG